MNATPVATKRRSYKKGTSNFTNQASLGILNNRSTERSIYEEGEGVKESPWVNY